MATATYYSAGTTAGGAAYITDATASLITVSIPSIGIEDHYRGIFFYNSSGDLSSGTLTGFDETYFGQRTLVVTNLFTPAVPIANAIKTGDMATVVSLVFAGSDEIFGSSSGDAIAGFAGNDTIIALDGNDTVTGGDGNDDVNGNMGQDIVLGGTGADTVRGGQGNDTIYGEEGDDPHVNGNIGNDIVSGGAGNDTVYGGQGNDTLYGDAGNDLLSGDLGNDTLFGGAGADRFNLRAGGGIDVVADFNAAEGDRIMLTPGTAYTVLNASGQVVIDIGGGAQIGLSGVAFASFSADWIVFG